MKTLTAGIKALTTETELAEVSIVGKRRKLKFAFWQKTLNGAKIPFWHVNYLNESDFGTTLSVEGWQNLKSRGTL